MNTAEFWVLLAFLVFLGLFGKKVYVLICNFLDEYIDSVKKTINNSKKNKSESIKILNEAKSKGEKIQEQIETLKKDCDKNINDLDQYYKDTLDKFKINSEKQLESDVAFEIDESKKVLSEKIKSEMISSIKEKFKDKKFDVSVLKKYKTEISELFK